ncbi:MAG: aminopeptidase P family protein [Acholeplasmataceae bacterium]|nr:aminopeptidase P family protein [Acholeplasmataceae bacterium]
MHIKRRAQYFSQIQKNSISFFFSGRAPQKAGDQNYPFSVNRNFFYLTGIHQENVVLMLIKGEKENAAYLFIDKIDPVKSLWDGAGLTFEEAADIAQMEMKDIKDIEVMKTTLAQLLTTSRKAIFGPLETAYLDLERQNALALKTDGEHFALYVKDLYPFLQIRSSQVVLAEMRMVKDDFEISQIEKAMFITNHALSHVMKTLRPSKFEYEMEAEYNYILNKHRVTPSFDTIAASGKNATTLHYITNDSKMEDHTLILFDLGVNYDYYCSDITRVYPVNGKFSPRQKEIYEVVLDVNKKAIEWLKPGKTIKEFNEYGKALLTEGAKKLGLIKEDHEIDRYYYHSLGHYLGLEVHDAGNYSLPIPEGAVITVEPGLYVAEEAIGIRIEDDVIVGKNKNINLSKHILKEIADIEDFMKI